MFNLDFFKNFFFFKDLRDKILFFIVSHIEQSFIDDSFISKKELATNLKDFELFENKI